MSKIKLVIEIEENDYEALRNDGVQNHIALADEIIRNGTPITEGDLISRSALKEKYIKLLDSAKELGTQVSPCFIDNAPTVEPTYQMPKDYIKNKLDYERPKGDTADSCDMNFFEPEKHMRGDENGKS